MPSHTGGTTAFVRERFYRMIFGFRASKYGPQKSGQGSKLRGCVLCRCPPQIGTPWQLCIISPSIFRQPDKKKGTVSKSQCLRLSKNSVFRAASRLKPRFQSNLDEKPRPTGTIFRPLYNSRGTQGELPHSGKRGWSGPRPREL